MVILEKDWFALDGILCTSVGLSCDTPPVQIMASRNGITYTTGADEELYIDDDSFSDITFRFKCYAIFPDGANPMDTTDVYAFLQGRRILTMSRNTLYYYKIRKIDCTPAQRFDGKRIDYTISIRCAPFKYFLTEEDIILTNGSGIVVNNGTRFCKPQYEITMSNPNGVGYLHVNSQVVTIAMTTVTAPKIIIDTEKMMAYTPQTHTNVTMCTTGIFRYLAVGNNAVAYTGDIESVKIKLNQRCY